MPGAGTQKTLPGPPVMVLHECSPNKDLVCLVGYSQGPLPPERMQLGSDLLLNDGWEGAMRNMREMGASELSRTSITLRGRYPGRELMVKVPRGGGKMILRLYLVNNIIFMVGVGGRGIEKGGQIPTRVIESFEVI